MTPKLPVCTPKDVERVFLKLGFFLHHQVVSHRVFRDLSGKHRVTIPMHNRDLKIQTLRSIIKQAGLTSEEFHTLLLGKRKSRIAG